MINAVIADDSALLRQVLAEKLEESGRIKVVAAAKNGKEAVECVKKHTPDILILDCEMPVMNGLEALRTVMSESPLPVFMFSSLTREGASVTIKALEYGAVDFLCKPTKGATALDEVAGELIRKIELIVTRNKFRTMQGGKPAAAPTRPSATLSSVSKKSIELIAMGSSTGGVQASTAIITKLPKQTRPIVWVQHMPPNFTASFAQRLDSLSEMYVKEAAHGDVVEPGTCYLAPGGLQMRIKKTATKAVLDIQEGEKVSGHCPSCNVLFDSVSDQYTTNVLGVILTGMGDDGACGLLKMRQKGAYVLGQNEESCVVYGMPKSAYELGAVHAEFHIDQMAEAIVRAGGA